MRQIVIGTAILVLALGLLAAVAGLPLADLRQTLALADAGLLMLALGAMLAVFPLWVWQWRAIALPLARVAWPVMTQVVAVSVTARVTTSGLGGIAGGGAALHLHAGLSGAGAASVMAVDQVLAGVAKLAVLALALAFVPLPPQVATAAAAVLVLIAGSAALALAAHRARDALRAALAGPRLSRARGAALRLIRDFAQLARCGVLVPATLLALAKKGFEVLAALAVQLAFGLEGAPHLALLAVASVSLVSLVPIAPVHLGPQAVALFATYAAFGVPPLQAGAIALAHQVLVLASTLALAAVAAGLHLWMRRRANAPS